VECCIPTESSPNNSRESSSSSTELYSEGLILTCLFLVANVGKEVASEKGKDVGVCN
jgi:hypothetical protein